LRAAVLRFRASGKPAVLFSQTMDGGGGTGTLAYYLASAFGQVWLQPSGDVALTGYGAESPFLKDALDRIGIQPQFAARYQYKSAIDVFTQNGITAPHRENLGALLAAWTNQTVTGIAQARHLAPAAVTGLMGNGPYVADEALADHLVDKLGYRDQALAAAKQAAGKDGPPRMLDIAAYGVRTATGSGPRIAVISGIGAIHAGHAAAPFGEDVGFAADSVAQAIRDAVADRRVKGILLRIDSPGGDYTASDTVRHEVERARAAGKPVVVSMGNLAASGGYFVALAANRVVAEPGTITGSIGVFGGKLVLKGLWDKLGVNWGALRDGANSGMWSANQPFTAAQWTRLNAMLDHIYADFTAKVEAARKIPADRIDQIARGRIWSGADAKTLGLVDALGGFDVAEAELRPLIKVAPGRPLDLVDYPRPKTPLQALVALVGRGADDLSAAGRMARVATALRPFSATLGLLAPSAARMEMPAALIPAEAGR
jgi:protease-4